MSIRKFYFVSTFIILSLSFPAVVNADLTPNKAISRIKNAYKIYKQQKSLEGYTFDQCYPLDTRPAEIQKQIDSVFEVIAETPFNKWSYRGRKEPYNLMDLDDEKLINTISNREKKHIYVLDVGSGGGGWGDLVSELLKDKYQKSDKHYQIISITGGKEQEENCTFVSSNIQHCRYSTLKLENIKDELEKKGLDLDSKVDLIVSNWTLQHLIDPFGTLKQLYQFLDPSSGFLLVRLPVSSFKGVDGDYQFSNVLPDLLSTGSIPYLIKKAHKGPRSRGDRDDLMLIRSSQNEFNIPLRFTGKTRLYQTVGQYMGSKGKFPDDKWGREDRDYPFDFLCASGKVAEYCIGEVKKNQGQSFKKLICHSEHCQTNSIYYGDPHVFQLLEKLGLFKDTLKTKH